MMAKIYNPASQNEIRLTGIADRTLHWVEDHQLLDRALWQKFVRQFRIHSDSANKGWRGEYWGKMMRGAVMVYQYTRNPSLYEILTETVKDLLTTQNADGSFSTYEPYNEFQRWDLWCRKYVMLGMEHYLEICTDENLKQRILTALCAHADAVLAKIGDRAEGKLPITETSKLYGGMSSVSILEPIIRLYRLTGETRYLRFAEYILSTGGSLDINIFELAYQDEIAPYAYGVNKAYEMMSCFEGVIEYYEVTGNEYYRDAALRFAKKVMETDVTVIGCCGTVSEFFDRSSVRQTEKPEGALQETCVSVTWMKLCRRLFAVSGDPVFPDAIEQTYYNAYLSTLNTERCHARNRGLSFLDGCVPTVLPFDSYSPLIPGVRGLLTGGAQLLDDGTYYGCCACIASAGAALYPQSMLWNANNGALLLSGYENGELPAVLPSGQKFRITISGNYPAPGKIRISLQLERPEVFPFGLRIPAWSEQSRLTVNGEEQPVGQGIHFIEREWKSGDTLDLELDFRVVITRAPIYEKETIYQINWQTGKCDPVEVSQSPEARNFVSFRQGPITLATDRRLGRNPNRAVKLSLHSGESVRSCQVDPRRIPYPCMNACIVKLPEEEVLLTDYASTGRLWSKESESAAWIPAEFTS